MEAQAHWDHIFRSKAVDQMSWHQDQPDLSLDMIKRSGISESERIIDIGSGISVLIASLLGENFQNVTALDISETALTAAKGQLGARSQAVEWLVGDVRSISLLSQTYYIWHDRAVFHFLTTAMDRAAYLQVLRKALVPGGQIIIATFADDGPERCSDLPVMRYSPELLTQTLGSDFELLESVRKVHITPWNSEQKFIYCRYRLT